MVLGVIGSVPVASDLWLRRTLWWQKHVCLMLASRHKVGTRVLRPPSSIKSSNCTLPQGSSISCQHHRLSTKPLAQAPLRDIADLSYNNTLIWGSIVCVFINSCVHFFPSVQDQDKKLQYLWTTCQKLPPQNFVNFRYAFEFAVC